MKAQSLSQSIHNLVDGSQKSLTIGDIVDHLDKKSFGLIFIIVAIPSGIPLLTTGTGMSLPLGSILMLLGWQLMLGYSTIWLPKKLRLVRFSTKKLQKITHFADWFFVKCEYWIKPRLSACIDSRLSRAILGFLAIIMGGLVFLPIPLTNTLPSILLIIMGMGLTQHDGLIGLMSIIACSITTLLYIAAFYLMYYYGLEGINQLITLFQ